MIVSKLQRDVHQLPRLQPRMKISRQVVTGSGRSCPTCPRQDLTSYNYQSYLPASDRQVRTERASVQSRRTAAGIIHMIFCQCGHLAGQSIVRRVTVDSTRCFDRAELDVGAVQESREKVDSHRPCLLYDRFCASADAMVCFRTRIGVRRSSGVVLDDFEAVSPQLADARVRFHGVSLSVISTHVARVRSKAPYGSLCEQPSHPLRLLVTKLPFSATSMLVWDWFAHPSLEFTIGRSRTETVPCSGTPLKGAIWLRPPPFFPSSTTWTSSHGTEHRNDHTCFSQIARSGGHHLHSQGSGAPCEERCRPRICCCASSASSMHASCSQRDKTKLHLSQLLDIVHASR